MTLSHLFGCVRVNRHDRVEAPYEMRKPSGALCDSLRNTDQSAFSKDDAQAAPQSDYLQRHGSLQFEASDRENPWQRHSAFSFRTTSFRHLRPQEHSLQFDRATLPRRTMGNNSLGNSSPHLRTTVSNDVMPVAKLEGSGMSSSRRGTKSVFRSTIRRSGSLFLSASMRLRRSFGRGGRRESPKVMISLPQLIQLRFGSKLVSHEKYRQLKIFSREFNAAQEVPASPLRRQDICAICELPVFLAERLKVGAKVLHRTCFQCARCKAQLTPASSYETESGDYCCEVCPDEERSLDSSFQSLSANSTAWENKEAERIIVEDKGKSEEEKAEENPEKQKSVQRFPSSVKSLISRFDSAAARSAFFAKELQSSCEPPEKPPRSPIANEDEASQEKFSTRFDQEVNSSPFQISNEKINTPFDEDEKSTDDEKASTPFDEEIEENPDVILKQTDGGGGDAELNCSASVHDSVISEKVLVSDEVCDSENVVNKPHSDDDDLNAQNREEITPSGDPPLAPIESESDNPAPADRTGVEVASVLPVASPRRRGKTKSQVKEYPEDLNPFEDDDEETSTPVSTDHKEEKEPPVRNDTSASYNPFEEEDLDANNPFAADDDEEPNKTPKSPVPTPRISLMSTSQSQQSFVRSVSPTLSMKSSMSMTPTTKKRLAPPPGSQTQSRPVSPASTIGRYRKDRRAPLPPTLTPKETQPKTDQIEKCPLPDLVSMNTQQRRDNSDPDVVSDESCRKSDDIFRKSGDGKIGEVPDSKETRICHKNEKDKMNENRKSSSDSRKYEVPNKDTYGQWKRKKGPAPPRPLPQKRQLRKLPMRQIQQELNDLEIQQREMERQGVALERQIRAITESSPDASDDNSIQSLKLEAEDLILQLFDIVNEKNELLRRQTELMYLKRQQRLEEEYVELEYQIRCLLEKSENNRTEEDRKREEELIQRLVLVVERRAEIVDCLELERRRGEEEDTSIKCHLEAYNLKQEPTSSSSPETPESKSSKSKFKSPAKLLLKVSEHKKKPKAEGEPPTDKKAKPKWFKK